MSRRRGDMTATDSGDTSSRLLHELRLRFPVVQRPFMEIGERLGLSEDEVLGRTRELVQRGTVRRIGYMLGEHLLRDRASTLVGMKVGQGEAEKAAAIVGRLRGVTHSYLRDNEFNLWFTLSAADRAALDSELHSLADRVHPEDWIELPTVRFFKLRAPLDPPASASGRGSVDTLILRAMEDGIEIVPRPFAAVAEKARTDEGVVLVKLREMLSEGGLRSFGAVLHHGALGLTVNAMVAWDVGEGSTEICGEAFARMPVVSHCYARARIPGKWRYNLFTMVHVRTEDELGSFLTEGDNLTSGADRVVLRTLKEFKKTGVRV